MNDINRYDYIIISQSDRQGHYCRKLSWDLRHLLLDLFRYENWIVYLEVAWKASFWPEHYLSSKAEWKFESQAKQVHVDTSDLTQYFHTTFLKMKPPSNVFKQESSEKGFPNFVHGTSALDLKL